MIPAYEEFLKANGNRVDMSTSKICHTCGYALQLGRDECPNCGAIIAESLVEEILPPAAESGMQANPTPKTKTKTQSGSLMKPFNDLLKEAQASEEAGDLQAALETYHQARSYAIENQRKDPAIRTAAQILDLLISRTEQLLAQPTARRDLANAQVVEPVLAPEMTPQSLVEEDKDERAQNSNAIPRMVSVTIPPPAPSRSKFDRTLILVIMGAVVLLGLACLMISWAMASGDLSILLSTRTHSPTPGWEVNINDPFDSNENSWPAKANFRYSCGVEDMYIQDGKLVWKLATAVDCFWWELPELEAFSNFSYFVDIERISAPADSDYGIVFREQENGSLYSFLISDLTQTYAFFLYQQESWKTLINFTSNNSIKSNDVNRIGVIARGSEFQLFINGTIIATYSDFTLSSGAVGVAVEPRGSGAETILEFDNFELNANP